MGQLKSLSTKQFLSQFSAAKVVKMERKIGTDESSTWKSETGEKRGSRNRGHVAARHDATERGWDVKKKKIFFVCEKKFPTDLEWISFVSISQFAEWEIKFL